VRKTNFVISLVGEAGVVQKCWYRSAMVHFNRNLGELKVENISHLVEAAVSSVGKKWLAFSLFI